MLRGIFLTCPSGVSKEEEQFVMELQSKADM